MFFINNYNHKILKDLEDEESKVICSALGSMKTTTVKNYIYNNGFKKILLVVNLKSNQEEFSTELPDNVIVVNSDFGSRLNLKQAIESLDDTRFNCVCITKVRFNYMITVNTKLFDDFDKIIIDESNGLNPLIQEDFDDSLKSLLEMLGNVLKNTKLIAYEKGKELLDFLYVINSKLINNNKTTKMTHLKISDKYREIAKIVRDEIVILYEEDKISEHEIVKIFGLLNSIIDNKLHFNEYNNVKGKKSSVLFCNRFLKDFIATKNLSIKVLDGTAKFIEPLYKWLKLPIKDDYIENNKEYSNMKIHYYRFADITSFQGRSDEELKKKMLEFMKKEKIPNDFLLFTNKTSVDIFKEHYHKTNYVFSGKDIGSNEFREEENLAVVFYNTLPQSYRLMYNKEIKGMSIKEASSSLELEIAEYELVGSLMVQLVGRLKIREDNNANVSIYMFCVPPTTANSIKQHFKIKQENIFIYDCSLDLRKKVQLSVSGLFYILDLELSNNLDKIDIKNIAKEYFREDLKTDSIRQTKNRYNKKFEELAKKHGYLYNKKDWIYKKI